ncbi:MAG: ATP-binding protein, partial [Patescibacteria group bacterium]|nr:ATP-binding protein [Patescibacteria group bacterium]
EIGNIANLQTLDLSFNMLENLPPEIGQLHNLQALFLGCNRLAALPPEIGGLVNLQLLYVMCNYRLENLPGEIGQLRNLQTLNLKSNNLKALPTEFWQLKNLQNLSLSNNQFKTLSSEIGQLTKLQKSLVDKAYESNERQLDTINEMLFVARADAGELNISIKKIDITRLVNGVTVDMRQMIAKNMQTMQINLPDKQLIINGDQQYLRMAIENIISNASKYTKPGGHISVCLIEMGEKSVQLSVKDNGVGINKSDLRLLFKKFSRIPNELTGKVVGSGIGLYLVRKIIDAHHGEIIVDSTEDVGTTINIILPKA